jgi:hypothetical protein
LWDRLPTKANLANRGIIPLEARLCVTRCGHVEDVNHLFLSCPIFGALWPLVRAWLGVEGVDPQHISDQFFAIYSLRRLLEIAKISFPFDLPSVCLGPME